MRYSRFEAHICDDLDHDIIMENSTDYVETGEAYYRRV
jgi:hypothetical protein